MKFRTVLKANYLLKNGPFVDNYEIRYYIIIMVPFNIDPKTYIYNIDHNEGQWFKMDEELLMWNALNSEIYEIIYNTRFIY